MKFISNAGSDRVLDLIRPGLGRGHKLDMVSDTFSLFAFAELLTELYVLEKARIVVPPPSKVALLFHTSRQTTLDCLVPLVTVLRATSFKCIGRPAN